MLVREPHKGDQPSVKHEAPHVAEHRRLHAERGRSGVVYNENVLTPGKTILGKIYDVVSAGDPAVVKYKWTPVVVTDGATVDAAYTQSGLLGNNEGLPFLVEVGRTAGDSPSYKEDDIVLIHIIDGENGLAYCVNGKIPSGGQADNGYFSFEAHYADEYFNSTTPDFYTEQGFLNCFLDIALDLRKCTYAVPPGTPGTHPGWTKPILSGVSWGNTINTWDGDNDTWTELVYSATDTDGTDLGRGVEAIADLKIECQIKTTGELNLRLYDHTNSSIYFSLVGALRRVVHPRLEIGTQIEFGRLTCHECPASGNTWGDGVWTPGT